MNRRHKLVKSPELPGPSQRSIGILVWSRDPERQFHHEHDADTDCVVNGLRIYPPAVQCFDPRCKRNIGTLEDDMIIARRVADQIEAWLAAPPRIIPERAREYLANRPQPEEVT